MNTGKLAIAGLAVSLALGGGVAAIADTTDDPAIQEIELKDRDDGRLRRDEAGDEIAVVEDDDIDRTGDRDRTRGDDGTNGGDNTGDGDATNGNDGTNGGDNTGDGDATYGNDGTAGGENTGSYGGGGGDTDDGGSGGGTTG